jgi:uncharacterized protein (DUF885 family)
LGERRVRNAKVEGSIPFSSTIMQGIRRGAILAVLALAWNSAAAAAGSGQAQMPPGNRAFQQAFGPKFFAAYWKLHPDDAVAAGYYAVAGEMLIPDAAARARRLLFIDAALARLQAIPAQSLDGANRSDRAVLENELRRERWELTTFREWQWNPAIYNIAEPFDLLLGTDYAPLPQRLRSVLARLAFVPGYFAAAKQNIADPTLEHTQLAIEQSTGALAVFGAALDQQVAGAALSDAERVLFATRIAAARAAIADYIDWLKASERKLQAGTPRSFRIGRERYEEKFAFEIASGSTARALYERAQAERERLLTRMDLLAEELWPKYFPNAAKPDDRFDKIGAVIRELSKQHIARSELFGEVQRLIPELTQWVNDHRLITLDASRPLDVRVTPPYEQGIAGASVDAPGPYNPTAHTYFNVTPLDSLSPERAESFLNEYNRWVLPVLVIHEAIPGHYVQGLYANKSPSLIKSVFGNGAMVEGWAVYAERMMLESGYGNDTAEQWLLYSKWNLRSVCNTLLDYGVHVLNMGEGDAHRFLTREAFQTEEEARGKWQRVIRTNVQLTSYFAGYSEIYDFRERLKREEGPGFDLRRFHEQFLSYGSAPIRIIEELMTVPP